MVLGYTPQFIPSFIVFEPNPNLKAVNKILWSSILKEQQMSCEHQMQRLLLPSAAQDACFEGAFCSLSLWPVRLHWQCRHHCTWQSWCYQPNVQFAWQQKSCEFVTVLCEQKTNLLALLMFKLQTPQRSRHNCAFKSYVSWPFLDNVVLESYQLMN